MIGTTNFDQPLKEADLLFECHFCKKQTIPLPKAFVFFSSNKSNSLSLFHQMIHHCMDNDQQKSYRATKTIIFVIQFIIAKTIFYVTYLPSAVAYLINSLRPYYWRFYCQNTLTPNV